MKKIFRSLLTLTLIFSLLCTSVLADDGKNGGIDSNPQGEELYWNDFTELINYIEGIEESDQEKLEELFKEIYELEEKLNPLWEKVDSILEKYMGDDLEDSFFDSDFDHYDEECECCGDGAFDEGFYEQEKFIISYTNKDGNLIVGEKPELEREDHISLQKNHKLHNDVWKIIKDIISTKYLKMITHFEINTDGKEGVLAHVVQTTEDNSKWAISVDIADVIKESGEINRKELSETIIHEFGHLLSLNNEQVEAREAAENDKTYITQEGVTKESSYLNKFYQKFWKDIYDEWTKLNEIENDEEYEEAMQKFYEKYETRFINDYASSNPGEDFAETFRVFVTEGKPEGKTIAEKKVLFLYSFPELVKISDGIRKALNIQ